MDRLARRQLAATAALVAVAAGATLLVSPGAVVDGLEGLSARPLAFALALLAAYLVRPLLAWPISPISVVVGFVLGVTAGFPVALAGAVLTSVPPYLVARHASGPGGLFAGLTETGQGVIEVTGETRGVLAARLSPLPADPVSYGAGFSQVSPRAFVVGTLVGEVPWVALEVLAGASMRHLTAAGLQAGLHVILASAALAVLLLAGPTYRYVRQRRPA